MRIRKIGSSSRWFRRLCSIAAFAGFGLSLVWLSAQQTQPPADQSAPASTATPTITAGQPVAGGQNPAPAAPASGQASPGQVSTGTVQAKNSPEKGSSDVSILGWIWKTDSERQGLSLWLYGALLLLLGAVGGMITAFYSVGEALPGIGGAGLIEPEVARMQAFEDAIKICATSLDEIQAKLRNCDPARDDPKCTANLQFVAAQYVDQIKMYEEHVARLRDLINANR